MVATFYLSREYKVAMYKEAKTTKQDTNRLHGDKELLADQSRRVGSWQGYSVASGSYIHQSHTLKHILIVAKLYLSRE
jgi:hypothetical protein